MIGMGLGTSITTLNIGLVHEFVEDLRNSSIVTFELGEETFRHDYDRAIRAHFLQMLNDTGKKAYSYHFPFAVYENLASLDEVERHRAVSRFRAVLQEAFSLGCRLMVIHSATGPVDQTRRAEHVQAVRQSLREVEFDLKAFGMKAALEYLPGGGIGNSVENLQEIWEGFDDTFGCCLDVNHLGKKVMELPQIVHALGPKLLTTHISTCEGYTEQHLMPLPGKEGIIPWKELFTALQEISYQGPFNFETHFNKEIEFADRIRELDMCFDSLVKKYFVPLG